jgi:hypothetical protein
LLPCVSLAIACALAAAAQGPPPSPGAAITDFSSRGEEWAWIVTTGEKTRLLTGGPGNAGRGVAEGAGWTDVAVGANQLWVLQSAGGRSRLLQAPKSGGEPREALTLEGSAGALFALDDHAYWLELTAAREPGLAYIPTLGGAVRLRRTDAAGAAVTLAEWPSGGRIDARNLDIIGVGGGKLYVAVFNGVGTEFLAAPLAGGAPVRVAAEADFQHGVIHQDRLVWTAPSEEATPASRIRMLRAQGDGSEVRTLADWVPAIGDALSVGDRLYYAGSGNIYHVPGDAEPPVFTGEIAFGPVVTDGKRLIEAAGAAPVAKAP